MAAHFIYGLYDPRDGLLRYIGCTKDIQKRLVIHCRKPLKCLRVWLEELKAGSP